ncbi:MAG: archaellin/type IV pilin N-terminal domain-containing protein, partial [Methanocella sp.]
EAAIVLIAFVVVAAVFSYVMLGAGFFTSQKSKEVVHTGVDQATSSIQLAGDLVGAGDTTGQQLTGVNITLSLTAGNNPVDIQKLIVSARTSSAYNASMFDGLQADQVLWVQRINQNDLLEKFEKVQLNIPVNSSLQIGPNERITFEIKPATGAIMAVSVTTPPAIDAVMLLV